MTVTVLVYGSVFLIGLLLGLLIVKMMLKFLDFVSQEKTGD